jgi:hypothetical protein
MGKNNDSPGGPIARLRRLFSSLRQGVRSKATGMLAWECREYENLFALMVLAPAAGIAGPPTLLALDLLPDLERELLVLLDRARESGDPYGELCSIFEVG